LMERGEEGEAGPDARTDFRRSALPFLARKKIEKCDAGNSSNRTTTIQCKNYLQVERPSC
jgi:hypothetical protein